jgi:HemY protein
MIRFLILIAVLFAIVLGLEWLKDTPGELAVTIGDTTYAVGLARALIGLILLVLALMVVLWLVRLVLGAPFMAARALQARNEARGRQALSTGLIAAAAGDVRSAERAAQEARRRAPDSPLALLLTAQTAQLKGDRGAARESFMAMLEAPEMRAVGLRGMHMEAEREGEIEAARHYASAALELAPAPWAGRALIRYQVAGREWDEALRTLAGLSDSRAVDRKTARRWRAVILAGQALDLEDGDPERARRAASEAHDLAPDLVPAAVAAGRLLSRLGDIRRAARVLEASWKAFPHPELAEAYIHVRPGDSARDRLKRAEVLARIRPHADEGRLALARAAIDARDWGAAREALLPVLRNRATQAAMLLMAEIEEGEHGDRGRAREWLARAINAPRDPAWVADGAVLAEWAPLSPVTGRIDAVEWRVPVEQLGAPTLLAIDEEALAPAEPRPVEPPAAPAGMAAPAAAAASGEAHAAEAPAEAETSTAPGSEVREAPARDDRAVTADVSEEPQSAPPASEDRPAAAGAEPAGPAEPQPPARANGGGEPAGPTAAETPPPTARAADLPRPPDDPGVEEGEQEEPRRFRLF